MADKLLFGISALKIDQISTKQLLQLNIVDGKLQYLFDEDGRRYLDAFGGIATVCCGHCHPDVIEAIVNQAKKIQHSTVLYLNHAIADFAEALASKMPGDLKVLSA
jgi:alanine-glyoxylate transaminase/(R)-3-amino-2-methylpropionate-pyruvate transaminase